MEIVWSRTLVIAASRSPTSLALLRRRFRKNVRQRTTKRRIYMKDYLAPIFAATTTNEVCAALQRALDSLRANKYFGNGPGVD